MPSFSSSRTTWPLPVPTLVTSLVGSARQKQRPPCSFQIHCPVRSGDPSVFLSTNLLLRPVWNVHPGQVFHLFHLSFPLACSRPCFLYLCRPAKGLNQDFELSCARTGKSHWGKNGASIKVRLLLFWNDFYHKRQ